jgi:solute carrier family 25 2-oxodicarboxylate transporter 21
MSDKPQQPLPFIYQFAAGAVAGVSEVCVYVPIEIARLYMSAWSRRVTPRKVPNN